MLERFPPRLDLWRVTACLKLRSATRRPAAVFNVYGGQLIGLDMFGMAL